MGLGWANRAQSYRGADPPPLHLPTGPYRIRHPEGSGHLVGSGHPTDWTRKHRPHLQPTREQVVSDTGSSPGQGMGRRRSSSGLDVGSESARGGQTESGAILLHGISFASWKKGWRSPRSTLSAYLAWSREKSWLGSTPSFKPALQGSWVRPGVVFFPCARHGFTCPGWGPVLAQAWGIPHRGHGAKGE